MVVQRRCRTLLESWGLQVDGESSLGSAKRYLRQVRPDVILLDLFLPDGTGYELFRTGDLPPVIAMTGVYMGALNTTLLQARYPLAVLLPKPLEDQVLAEELSTILGANSPSALLEAKSSLLDSLDAQLGQIDALLLDDDSAEPTQIKSMADIVPRGRNNTFVSPLSGNTDVISREAIAAWDPTRNSHQQRAQALSYASRQAPAYAMDSPTPNAEINPHELSTPSVPIASMEAARSAHTPAPEHVPQQAQTLAPSDATALIDTRKPAKSASGARRVPLLFPRDPFAEGLYVPPMLSVHDVPDEGDFAYQAFPLVLGRLGLDQSSGQLLLRRGDTKKMIGFRSGLPIAVKSNLIEECLGQLLVREGVLRQDTCDLSVHRAHQEGRLQGEILLEMGVISTGDLEEALRLQFEEKLFDMMGWTDGLFQFRRGHSGEFPYEATGNHAFTLLTNGVRAALNEHILSRALDECDLMVPTLLVPRADLQVLRLSQEEIGWTRLMDGRRTLGQVTIVAGPGSYRLVYALVAMGAMAFRAQ